jgi:hypothetical protein
MPSYLAPIWPASTVAHLIHAGILSTKYPPGCCSLIFTRDPCGMAGRPCGSTAHAAAPRCPRRAHTVKQLSRPLLTGGYLHFSGHHRAEESTMGGPSDVYTLFKYCKHFLCDAMAHSTSRCCRPSKEEAHVQGQCAAQSCLSRKGSHSQQWSALHR